MMVEKRILYFAYGSNMNQKQMAHRCPGAKPIGRAALRGYRFLINQTGYATLVPSPQSRVEGILWELEPGHTETLDQYEDHYEGFYDRCYREVVAVDGGKRMALVYIDHRQTDLARPGDGYLESIVEGAIENALPKEYIDNLRSFGERR